MLHQLSVLQSLHHHQHDSKIDMVLLGTTVHHGITTIYLKTFPYAHAALRLATRAVKGGFGHENLRRRAMLANDEAHAEIISLIAVAHGLAGGRAAILRGAHP